MTLPELLTYIFQNFFGHIIIAISVVLAALTFTKYEDKLDKILKIVENQPEPSSVPSGLPSQFEKFREKGEKATATVPSSPSVAQEFEKMTRHEERIKGETKVET